MIHYTVNPGDSLWKISRAHHISLDALLAANPQIEDANDIIAGTVIHIPQLRCEPVCPEQKEDSRPALPECGNEQRPCIYRAQEGETLESIAKKFMIPNSQIIYYNLRYGKREPLPAGSRVVIPGKEEKCRNLPRAYQDLCKK